jgi:phosphomannomutase
MTQNTGSIAASIFKANDIRGTYPDELDEAAARAIGTAAVQRFAASQVVVGRDMRLSSPALHAALVEGVTAAGADVVDLGMVSIDELYFASGQYRYSLGVMITASHNPPQYNGLKFCLPGAVEVGADQGLDDIKALVLSGRLPAPAARYGTITARDVREEYAVKVRSFVDVARLRPLTVAVDAGNGMAGTTVPAGFAGLPIAIEPLYFEPDGHFPHHLASPIEPQNMADVQALVRRSGADLGAAFDGDADRVFLTDEQGAIVDGSMLAALVARALLGKNPGATIVYNSVVSRCVPELVTRLGGQAVRARVGHAFMNEAMRAHDAIFGAEHSGHFYFRDFWYADSGLIALMSALEVIAEDSRPVSALITGLCSRVRSGEINSRVGDIPAIFDRLKQAFSDGHLDELDGVTITYPDWWLSVRPSNTEPVLRLNVEADNRALMERQRDAVLRLIRQ